MLTGLACQTQQSTRSARYSSQIKEFSTIRRLEIPSDDLNGTLLNEAVAVHLDQMDHAGAVIDGSQ
jgi:hypothetical protein